MNDLQNDLPTLANQAEAFALARDLVSKHADLDGILRLGNLIIVLDKGRANITPPKNSGTAKNAASVLTVLRVTDNRIVLKASDDEITTFIPDDAWLDTLRRYALFWPGREDQEGNG